MKITVLGSGYVGLVTAAGFAEMGHHVLCVDIDASRVQRLQRGEVPFFEPGLAELVRSCAHDRRLSFATDVIGDFARSDAYFVAVGTPPGERARADVSAVFAAAEAVAARAEAPAVLAIKSTVPVGTCDAVDRWVRDRSTRPLAVASNPEFLKEGAALDDFRRPDRVVIGVANAEAETALRALYRPLQLSTERILVMDRRSAELSKYTANAMLATRISFMNELSQLCDRLGADITAVRRAVGSDHRIGPHFLYAGPGYGGSCFPKDVAALAAQARDCEVELGVIEAASRANARQQRYVFERVSSLFPDGLKGRTIAIWGLAFKPETDDVRESPSLGLVRSLAGSGAFVRAHDPQAAHNFHDAIDVPVEYCASEYDAIDGADALVVMTEWRRYRNPEFDEIKRRMRSPRVMDARNIWVTHGMRARGFEYVAIGTPAGRQ